MSSERAVVFCTHVVPIDLLLVPPQPYDELSLGLNSGSSDAALISGSIAVLVDFCSSS